MRRAVPPRKPSHAGNALCSSSGVAHPADDPEQVAADFCAKNGLPPDYRDQIVAHVAPLVDPVLVAQRKHVG